MYDQPDFDSPIRMHLSQDESIHRFAKHNIEQIEMLKFQRTEDHNIGLEIFVPKIFKAMEEETPIAKVRTIQNKNTKLALIEMVYALRPAVEKVGGEREKRRLQILDNILAAIPQTIETENTAPQADDSSDDDIEVEVRTIDSETGLLSPSQRLPSTPFIVPDDFGDDEGSSENSDGDPDTYPNARNLMRIAMQSGAQAARWCKTKAGGEHAKVGKMLHRFMYKFTSSHVPLYMLATLQEGFLISFYLYDYLHFDCDPSGIPGFEQVAERDFAANPTEAHKLLQGYCGKRNLLQSVFAETPSHQITQTLLFFTSQVFFVMRELMLWQFDEAKGIKPKIKLFMHNMFASGFFWNVAFFVISTIINSGFRYLAHNNPLLDQLPQKLTADILNTNSTMLCAKTEAPDNYSCLFRVVLPKLSTLAGKLYPLYVGLIASGFLLIMQQLQTWACWCHSWATWWSGPDLEKGREELETQSACEQFEQQERAVRAQPIELTSIPPAPPPIPSSVSSRTSSCSSFSETDPLLMNQEITIGYGGTATASQGSILWDGNPLFEEQQEGDSGASTISINDLAITTFASTCFASGTNPNILLDAGSVFTKENLNSYLLDIMIKASAYNKNKSWHNLEVLFKKTKNLKDLVVGLITALTNQKNVDRINEFIDIDMLRRAYSFVERTIIYAGKSDATIKFIPPLVSCMEIIPMWSSFTLIGNKYFMATLGQAHASLNSMLHDHWKRGRRQRKEMESDWPKKVLSIINNCDINHNPRIEVGLQDIPAILHYNLTNMTHNLYHLLCARLQAMDNSFLENHERALANTIFTERGLATPVILKDFPNIDCQNIDEVSEKIDARLYFIENPKYQGAYKRDAYAEIVR